MDGVGFGRYRVLVLSSSMSGVRKRAFVFFFFLFGWPASVAHHRADGCGAILTTDATEQDRVRTPYLVLHSIGATYAFSGVELISSLLNRDVVHLRGMGSCDDHSFRNNIAVNEPRAPQLYQ